MSAHLRLEIADARATITLDRPEKRNMLETADLAVLDGFLERVEKTAALRVLVVTGTGERAFSSGFAHGDVDDTDWRANPIEATINRLAALRLPTVCALNGGAYGASADRALACDFRIGVSGMRVALPAARLGVMYNLSGLARIIHRVGPGPARRLLLAGEEMDAETLLAVGYLDRLVPRDALAAETARLVERIAALAPRAVQGMKRALVGIERGDLDRAWAEAEILACFASDDLKEGLAAFAARRAARFTGR